jgi:protein-S-isoprenylcysteine O-methyltransferase Ste14
MTLSPTLIKAVILFPLNVMGVIPLLILWFSQKIELYQLKIIPTISGGIFITLGLYIIWITVSLFTDYGKGTPAPYCPPKVLVTIGIYGYVRNPMMLGVWFVLVGEAILFMCSEMLIWFFIFFFGSIIVVTIWEERGLENRFGENYREYKRKVPRWIPRIKHSST